MEHQQGFPKVLRTWVGAVPVIGGGSSKFDEGGGEGLKSKHGGAWQELKKPSKNTCKGVRLIAKLPAISLEAS